MGLLLNMEKLEVLREVVKKLYPDITFVIRINKKGKYEIIFRNVREYKLSEDYLRRVIKLKDGKTIPVDTFGDNIQGFFPFFNEKNSVIKILMLNGKTVRLNG